jgi:hypothetical protein
MFWPLDVKLLKFLCRRFLELVKRELTKLKYNEINSYYLGYVCFSL